MIYMLDTNICGYIIRDNPIGIYEKFKTIDQNHTIALSSIVVSELYFGVVKKGSPKLSKIISDFVDSFIVYDYDKQAAIKYGEVRQNLETSGKIIGANDLLIASHALSIDATLVTNNTKEFERISGLRVENWV